MLHYVIVKYVSPYKHMLRVYIVTPDFRLQSTNTKKMRFFYIFFLAQLAEPRNKGIMPLRMAMADFVLPSTKPLEKLTAKADCV